MLPNDPNWPRASAWLAGEHFENSIGELAVLGAPAALGSISPGRSDQAPQAIRAALARFSTYDVEFDRDLRSLAARDLGDLPIAALCPEAAFEPVYNAVTSALHSAAAVAILGGDNSITYPGAKSAGGLLTFDAHFDLRDLDGGLSNGNPIRALLADGFPGSQIIQVGIQSFANSKAYRDVARDAGIKFVTADHVRERGIENVTAEALSSLARNGGFIYVDFDLDVLDRSFVPATPGSRPGGLAPWGAAPRRSSMRSAFPCTRYRSGGDRSYEGHRRCDIAHRGRMPAFLCIRIASEIGRLMQRFAVVGCSQLLTLAGPARPRTGAELRDLGILKDGAMIVADGRIERIGTRREIESAIGRDGAIVDAGGRIVLPGFLDAHTHPVFAGNRANEFEQRIGGATYAEIAAAGGGIRSTVRQTRAAGEDRLLAAASRYTPWFLRNGTTTIEGKSGYGLTPEDEYKLLRVIARIQPLRVVPTFLGAHEVPDEFRSRPTDYADVIVHEMLPYVAAGKLARYCDIFCEPGIFDIAESRRILTAAKSLGLGLRLHADQLSQSGAAELAAELGAATADHLEHTNAHGIAALRAAGVQPVLLPGSVYALGSSRYPDARAMIAADLAVVLATDFNPGSSPTPSLPMILSLACTQMKMTPAEAIVAATINPAYSLGMGGEIGSLEPGKLADFVIHDCEDFREIPYFFGVEPAKAVFIGGHQVFCRAAVLD